MFSRGSGDENGDGDFDDFGGHGNEEADMDDMDGYEEEDDGVHIDDEDASGEEEEGDGEEALKSDDSGDEEEDEEEDDEEEEDEEAQEEPDEAQQEDKVAARESHLSDASEESGSASGSESGSDSDRGSDSASSSSQSDPDSDALDQEEKQRGKKRPKVELKRRQDPEESKAPNDLKSKKPPPKKKKKAPLKKVVLTGPKPLAKPKKKKLKDVGSDEELENKDKSFGRSNFHHFIHFFLHDTAGIYTTSNQIHTPQEIIRQHLHFYYKIAENAIRMMAEVRGMRFCFHDGIPLSVWREFVALETKELQLAWLLDNNLRFYLGQHDLNLVWQEIATFWWTEERYQAFAEKVKALAPEANMSDLPPEPKAVTLVTFTVFNPNKDNLRIWKNRTLQNYLKRKNVYRIEKILLLYCKGYNLTDKSKKKGVKDNDPLVKKDFKKLFWQWRAQLARPKYDCKLHIMTSNRLMLFVPDFFIMPEFERLSPDEFPEPIDKMLGRPFGVMYSTDAMVQLNDWEPGDYVRIVSYLDRTHPYVEIRLIVPAPSLYVKYSAEQIAKFTEAVNYASASLGLGTSFQDLTKRVLQTGLQAPPLVSHAQAQGQAQAPEDGDLIFSFVAPPEDAPMPPAPLAFSANTMYDE